MTVQEIQEIGFEKAVFGGYDMKSVDTFLERVAEEFAAMQKENAAMKAKMKEVIDPTLSYKNAAHATWQFANEMKVGDIIFVKKGMYQLVGRGVVTSDYEYDDERTDEYANYRKGNWTHNGEWPHPGQAVMKTLTDITAYT